ncbi:ABC transporter substrate-binding protein [Metabacillus endolithicus]|uniref:ABC transporter substrate-binding protein n=1 Tax=Metabacillus endolithicus TaxID=1535204 RepID=UPI001FFA7326|nr:ABC transporter substrate-binding protein [Metabacillus endolithicus]UPG62610.1 ABC transporter substrate-binding protein [Metabacillus endolithicus]
MKKIISLLSIVVSLFIILSACSNTSSSDSSDNNESKSKETVELKMAYISFGPEPADLELVQGEINKITKEEINVKVDLEPINVGQYAQQTNLMLSSGEKLDLLVTGNLSGFLDYPGQVAKGQLYPLNDLLDQHGQGIKDALSSDYLYTPTIGEDTYGVPQVRDLAMFRNLIIRKDLVDKYNIDLNSINTVEDLTDVFRVIKENEPDMYLMPNESTSASLVNSIGYMNGDFLADTIGVLLDSSKLEISNYVESEQYENEINLARKWYKAGYILPDVATNTESAQNLMKSGKVFAFFKSGIPYIAEKESRVVGHEVISVPISGSFTDTSTVTKFMWLIPQSAEYPEKSMELLNLFYSNADIMNLISWGIEGKHYVKVSDNVITYPEGVNADNIGYAPNAGWQFGNQMLTYVWEDTPPDMWEKMVELNESAEKSAALGFIFDTSPVKTELAAVTNVISQFKASIENGVVDPETELPKYQEKLKQAGIDKIIEEKQKQLDKWAETK